jgi:hypothetical protein
MANFGTKYLELFYTMTKKTYKDFDSREEFVQNLNHWHYDRWAKNHTEFKIVAQIDSAQFQHDLDEIKNQLETIRQTWNNQSQLRIRQETAKTKNSKTNLDILAGQENDRLRAGYNSEKSMYHVRQVEPGSVWENIAGQFGLENPMSRLHIQFPGDVTAWHTDIFAPYHDLLPDNLANSDDSTVGQDRGLRRIIIALEDWTWGQCFMFGAQTWAQWHAGDVVYWPFGTPHCAANMGFDPRICMSVTGTLTDQFSKIVV